MNKLCKCGCGKEVTNEKNKFLHGHCRKGNKESYLKQSQKYKEKTGFENPFQSDQIKEKIKQTNIKKYGVEFSALAASVIEKKKQTTIKKYGVDHYSKTNDYKNKIRNTCQTRYSVNNVFQLNQIKEKSKQTCLEKFGAENSYQSKIIQDKYKQTCLEKFGVDNYSKTFNFRLNARNRLIERITRNFGSINPRVGNNEKIFFEHLQKYTTYPIILNQYLIGYYPDGKIEELKLIIEFDEPEHFQRKWYQKRDKQKDIDFFLIGYSVLRIKEQDWLIQPEKIIEQFQNKIKEILCHSSFSTAQTEQARPPL